jgi:CotH kinase protein
MGRGMKVLMAALLTTLALAPAARAALTAESMYEPGTVVSIKLTLPEKSIKKLEKEPEEKYVEGTFSLAESTGPPSSLGAFSTPLTVGIKLKGSLGSLRKLNEKAAFKISFGKFVEGQTFLGLQKMTLNNMVQDKSMVHETMAYELFRANRVAGSHTGFAYLHVNLNGSEENFGMHLNIETMDSVALEKRFGPFQVPPQHLYSGEYKADVTPSTEGYFEVSEGEEDETPGEGKEGDLEALVAAVGGTSPADFSDRVASYADLQEMVHEWAVEKYIDHWDGYAGQQGEYWPNNYYLYSSAAGRFEMLPWGTDQTWADEPGSRVAFDQPAGVLFDKCLADSSCETMYLRALREVLASVPGLGLDSLAARTATLLEPWQALEQSPRNNGDAAEIHSAVESTRSFARSRPAELEAFLAGQPPEATATRVIVSTAPGTIPAGGGAGTVTATISGAAAEPIFGDQVSFSASDPALSFGPVVYQGEGIYVASFTGAPAPGQVTITATDSTSHVSGTATLLAEAAAPTPPAGGGGGGGAAASKAAATPPSVMPKVIVGKGPGRRTSDRRPRFTFASDQPGSTFVCRIGNKSFRPCSSPLRLPRLAPGHHVFSVAAVGPEWTRGTPQRYAFVVSIRRRTRVPD